MTTTAHHAAPALPLAVAILVLAAPARAEVITLETLLSDAQQAVPVRQAQSELDSATQELARDRAEKGWRFAGSLGYGHIQDVVDEGRSIGYQAGQAQLGFSYPLLGTSEKQVRAIAASSGKAAEKRVRLDAARRQSQLDLESSYARYWGAQEGLKLVEAYLESEPLLLPRLQQRRERRMMLASQFADVQAAYSRARSDREQLQAVRDETRSRLELLTGRALVGLQAQRVDLPDSLEPPAPENLRRHPELLALDAQRKSLEEQLGNSRWYGLDSAFNLTATGVHDITNAETGGNGFVGFNLSAPLSAGAMRRAERGRLRVEIEAVRLRYQDRWGGLFGGMGSAHARYRQQKEEVAVAARQSDAAREALRERLLRSNVFAADGVETLTAKLQTYYGIAQKDLDAQVQRWLRYVDAQSFALAVAEDDRAKAWPVSADSEVGTRLAEPIRAISRRLQTQGSLWPPAADGTAQPQLGHGPRPSPALASAIAPASFARLEAEPVRPVVFDPDPPSATPPAQAAQMPLQLTLARALSWVPAAARLLVPEAQASAPTTRGSGRTSDMGVYVWNSHELIDRLQHRDRFWSLLERLGIRRLLVSLDAAQIDESRQSPRRLRTFLDEAHRRGLKVDLLLGEPTWIEPPNRGGLIEIVQGLRTLPFDGLHLDIEPDQIYRQPLSRAQFDAWVETMAAAAKASAWPTAVSVHPRYLREAPYTDWQFGERLRQAGIRDVTMMIFNSSPQRSAEIAQPVLAANPGLRFRVAQSVEPQLAAAESHARRSPAEFETSMNQLRRLLPQANADGIVIQAWADLMRMGYESEIR